LILQDYFLENAIIDGFKRRDLVVTNPNDADVFIVPNYISEHFYTLKNYNRQQFEDYYFSKLRHFLLHVQHDLPYYNTSLVHNSDDNTAAILSSNHFFITSFDNGPFCDTNHHINEESVFTDVVWENIVGPMKQIGYYNQRFQSIPQHRQQTITPRRRTKCFDENHDIALPMWDGFGRNSEKVNSEIRQAAISCNDALTSNSSKSIDDCFRWKQFLHQRANQVTKPFYYYGSILSGKQCSNEIRPWLQRYCTKHSPQYCHFTDNNSINKKNDTNKDSTTTTTTTMSNSIFALCPAGQACWSARFYDAWDHWTIPIRLTEAIVEPFASAVPGGVDEYQHMMVSISTPREKHPKITMTDQYDNNITSVLNELAHLAMEWKDVCMNIDENKSTNATNSSTGIINTTMPCLEHPISKRLMTIVRNRRWFSWSNVEDTENAFVLLEQEIWKKVMPTKQGNEQETALIN
jgi:hypothetical protein